MMIKMNKIIYLLTVISGIILAIFTLILDVVPTKYLIIMGGILFFLYLLLAIATFKIKNKAGLIFLILLELIFMVAFGYGTYMIHKTNRFFDFSSSSKEQALYYVVVRKDSSYGKLADLDKKTTGTYSVHDTYYDEALSKIENKVSLTASEYTNLTELSDDLIAKKIDSIIISDINKELLDNETELFKETSKVIYTEKIVIKKKKEKVVSTNLNTFNILISGIDTNGDINKVSRSDVNIIMTVNPDTHEILLTNIPRDMYVQLDGTTGLKDKLTHAGIYGVGMSQRTLEDFLSTSIPYYLRVNFDSLVQIVDSIGGIDINNDIAFQGFSKYFAKGTIHLNGKQTLEYSRERKKMPNGDWTRGIHQEEVIRAILTKVSSSTELLTNYSEILNGLSKSIQTNLPSKIVKKQVKNQLDKMAGWNVYSNAVAGSGYDYLQTYSMPGAKLYVTIPEDASVLYNSKVINGMLNNKKYSEIK